MIYLIILSTDFPSNNKKNLSLIILRNQFFPIKNKNKKDNKKEK